MEELIAEAQPSYDNGIECRQIQRSVHHARVI